MPVGHADEARLQSNVGMRRMLVRVHEEHRSEIIKNEFERIQQFYRLALLMHCDGVLHEREQIKIREIGINMGLNPFAIKRDLKAMEQSPTRMVSPEFLLEVFQEQLN